MTAAAIPSRRERAAVRPVPWTRLAWVTWRQSRAALAGAVALLGVIAAYLAYMGWEIHRAYDSFNACRPASLRGLPLAGQLGPTPACGALQRAFMSFYGVGQGSVLASGINAQTVPFLLLAVPVLVGAFVGGPALARELESGTFRFAWTQGAGRVRLAAARLVPLAAALTAAAYGLSALFSWYIGPFVQAGVTGRFPMQLFGTTGTDFAAWTLFSFALTAFAGVLLRRTVTAMAASIVVLTAADVATMMSLRQHYMTPLAVTGTEPAGTGNWVVGNWFTTTGGGPVNQNAVFAAFAQFPPRTYASQSVAYLARHHYLQWWSYQPASRWWQFQLTEGGWLLAASLLLIAATVLLTRRRPA
ncbi:MAG TPA: hypothetical protein VG253_28225 [Streptosporangiaceae bacterium]|nr:hypothetical protein [Streptosporangiaceae bacterium]